MQNRKNGHAKVQIPGRKEKILVASHEESDKLVNNYSVLLLLWYNRVKGNQQPFYEYYTLNCVDPIALTQACREINERKEYSAKKSSFCVLL